MIPPRAILFPGNTRLSVGTNTVTVRVTAENGAVRNYTINVTRAAAATSENETQTTPEEPSDTPETPEEPETPENVIVHLADGTEMIVSDFDDSLVPIGFQRTEVEINGQTVSAISFPDGGSVAVYLTSLSEENGEVNTGRFYYYDFDLNIASPVYTVTSQSISLTILNIPDDFEAPEGYEKAPVTIGENTFYGFVSSDGTSDSYIVYAVSPRRAKLNCMFMTQRSKLFKNMELFLLLRKKCLLRPILTNILNILSG